MVHSQLLFCHYCGDGLRMRSALLSLHCIVVPRRHVGVVIIVTQAANCSVQFRLLMVLSKIVVFTLLLTIKIVSGFGHT